MPELLHSNESCFLIVSKDRGQRERETRSLLNFYKDTDSICEALPP